MNHDDDRRRLVRAYAEAGSRAEMLVQVAVMTGGFAALGLVVLVVVDLDRRWDLPWAVVLQLLGTLSIGSALTAIVLYRLRDVLWVLGESPRSSATEE